MRSKAPRTALSLILLASLSASSPALAHPITVDGDPTDWMSRSPNGDNLGMVVRDAQGRGEVIWRDTLADTRTDISTPEVVADIAAFQVTGDANGVAFLLRRPPGVSLAGAPIQVQIAVDLDRVDGSGQQFMAGFADTQVGSGARWERLVQTLFGSGGTATVLDTAFSSVAMVSAVQGGCRRRRDLRPVDRARPERAALLSDPLHGRHVPRAGERPHDRRRRRHVLQRAGCRQ
jgi:hypothetical protein